MFSPIDILDKDLYYKTPLLNTYLSRYIATFGKDCIFYINPNHEASENGVKNDLDKSTELNQEDVNNSVQRTDNYTLAYGKDMVGYDYSKLQKVPAKILADTKEYYVHEIAGEDNAMFYLQVRNIPISRGDIISYTLQDKQIFYRIADKVQSFNEIAYRVQCKLIQVKKLGGAMRPYDIHEHKPDYFILPENGLTRPTEDVQKYGNQYPESNYNGIVL